MERIFRSFKDLIVDFNDLSFDFSNDHHDKSEISLCGAVKG